MVSGPSHGPSRASLDSATATRPSEAETDAARRIPGLKAEFLKVMEEDVINRMGVSGLRSDDNWSSMIKPEAVAEMQRKLAGCGLTDAGFRNQWIDYLLGRFKNRDLPGDPQTLQTMIRVARDLGGLADYVCANPKDVVGQVMQEIKGSLSANQRASARKILGLMVEQHGITELPVLRAVLAYAYAESGFQMNCISDGGQSIGWFQLGPEVGIKRGHRDGAAQLRALLEKRRLDRRAARWLGNYYAKGRHGFETFRDWLNDNRGAPGSKIAQVFGLCVNPSMATLRGTGRPYADAFRHLFGHQ